MSVPELLTLISALTAAVIAIVHAVKGPKTRAQIDDTNTRVITLGIQMNGRLAELLEATRASAFHAGLLEGTSHRREGERWRAEHAEVEE